MGSRFTGAQAIIPAIAQVFYDQADDAYEHFTREHMATGAMSKIDTDRRRLAPRLPSTSAATTRTPSCRHGLEDPPPADTDAAAAKVCEDRGHHAMLVRIGTAFQILIPAAFKATAAARRRCREAAAAG